MMDEYFMHLKELYCEIRAANRLKVILTGIFIIKAGGGGGVFLFEIDPEIFCSFFLKILWKIL